MQTSIGGLNALSDLVTLDVDFAELGLFKRKLLLQGIDISLDFVNVLGEQCAFVKQISQLGLGQGDVGIDIDDDVAAVGELPL